MSGKPFFVRPSRWSILPKTVFAISWMTFLAGGFSMLLTVIVTQDRAEGNATRELGELLDTVERTVQVACFAEDQALAVEVVRGMLKNSKVLGVAIRVSDRDLARSYRRGASAGGGDEFKSVVMPIDVRRLTRPVASPFDPAQTVGEIILDPDPAAISRHAGEDVKFVGLLLGVQWLAIGGGLLVLVLMTVVRPIKAISDGLHRMDAERGDKLFSPDGQAHTEMGRLVEDINALASRLVAAIDLANEQTRQLREAKARVDAQAGQLEAKNIALGRALQVQEEMERIARHDLKTPLSSIATVPPLLRRIRRPNEEEEALLSIVENSAKRVLRMVSLSLDLYRMEEGIYAFHPRAVDIGALVQGVIRDLAEEAQARRVDFRLDAELPVFVYAEEILCYAILANLLRNAVEAAPRNTVVDISIELADAIRMSIHNEGAVPLAVRETFFDKYATHGKSQGTGLGTYSARLMACVQRGKLTMETFEESGTTLRLELQPLPHHYAAEMPLPRALPAGSSRVPGVGAGRMIPPLDILMVDDDPSNRHIMRIQLPSPPLHIEMANNGLEALEACRKNRPDVIFMDLEMPVMGGFEAMLRIRALQTERDQVPSQIIAFSAHDDEASRERCLNAGFDRHLSKPSSREEILALLSGAVLRNPDTADLTGGELESVVWVDEDLMDAMPGFFESRRALVADLRRALEVGDPESMRRLMHKLKGSFSMYGFKWAARICRELENSPESEKISAPGNGRASTDPLQEIDSERLFLQIDALEQHLARVKVRPRML